MRFPSHAILQGDDVKAFVPCSPPSHAAGHAKYRANVCAACRCVDCPGRSVGARRTGGWLIARMRYLFFLFLSLFSLRLFLPADSAEDSRTSTSFRGAALSAQPALTAFAGIGRADVADAADPHCFTQRLASIPGVGLCTVLVATSNTGALPARRVASAGLTDSPVLALAVAGLGLSSARPASFFSIAMGTSCFTNSESRTAPRPRQGSRSSS
jgi:hypothetical protein